MKIRRFLRAGVAGGILAPALMLLITIERRATSQPALQHAEENNSFQLVKQGRQIFRFDTFGDEAFWGGTLGLHQAIEGSALGGVGPGVSPISALSAGLKVDVDALPGSLVQQVLHGQVNLNDPAVTVALLKLKAVVGVTGVFDSSGEPSIAGYTVRALPFDCGQFTPALPVRASAKPRYGLCGPPA